MIIEIYENSLYVSEYKRRHHLDEEQLDQEDDPDHDKRQLYNFFSALVHNERALIITTNRQVVKLV